MKKKSIIIISIILVVLIGGGVLLATLLKGGGTPVEVVPIQYITMGWNPGGLNTYGIVTTEMSQQIYYSSDKTINEILVSEGQTVAVGDPILQYDATMAEVDLQLKKLEIEKKELDIKKAQAEIKSLKKQRTTARTSTASTQSDGVVLLNAMLNNNAYTQTVADINETAQPVSGDGTQATPYLFICPKGSVVQYGFINMMIAEAVAKTEPVYVKIETREGGTPDGELQYTISMVFQPDGTFTFEIKQPAEPGPGPGPGPDPDPDPEPIPVPPPMPPSGPTKGEIDKMIMDIEKRIRDDELTVKQAKMDIQKLESEGTDGVVKSIIAGRVKSIADPEDLINGDILIEIAGGDGYYIQCVIGELSLSKISLGTQMNAFFYESGASLVGTVIEIGDVPLTTQYYDGENSNNSGYLVKLYVEGGVELRNGEGAEITLMEEADPMSGLYIDRAYVRETDGVSYVFAAREGKLKRIEVITGKTMYGYIEIRSGDITMEDSLAFPYGNDVFDGAPVLTDGEENEDEKNVTSPGNPGVVFKRRVG